MVIILSRGYGYLNTRYANHNNNEDFARAKNKFNARKVKYVPGVGLDVEKLRNVVVDRSSKRAQLCIPEMPFTSISWELNNNKIMRWLSGHSQN